MRWPTSRSPWSSLTEPLSATRPGSVDGGVGLGDGCDAGGGDARVVRVAAQLGHERLDVGDPLLGAVGAVLGRDGVDRVETGAVVERAAEPLGDAGDGLVPGGEVAGRPRGAVEPVERVVRALVAVLGVEELAEAGLGAGDGDEEDGVDPVRLALGDEGGAGAGHGRAVLGEEGVELGGVGGRRGRRREARRPGRRPAARRAPPQGRRPTVLAVDPLPHQGSSSPPSRRSSIAGPAPCADPAPTPSRVAPVRETDAATDGSNGSAQRSPPTRRRAQQVGWTA